MRIVEIPVLGPPLAGKTTVLHRSRDAFGGHLRSFEFELETDDAFRGQRCRLAALHVQTHSAHGQIWCLPGGSSPHWVVPLLPHGSPAVFVIDPLRPAHDWIDAQAAHVDRRRSVVIVTKADLAKDAAPAIPEALRECPFIHVSARDSRSAADIERLITENFDAFVRPAGARPLQERVAFTVKP